jgi:acyl dehydratase
MALTSTNSIVQRPGSDGISNVTTGTLSITAGDVVCILYINEADILAGTLTLTYSGTQNYSWTAIGETAASDNCRAAAWFAVAPDSDDRTVTVSYTDGGSYIAGYVFTGAHATTPVPAGNRLTGTNASQGTQAITPTSAGSVLLMAVGDWGASAMTAGASCTADGSIVDPGRYSGIFLRPTTVPLSNTTEFTLSESGSSGPVAWVAFEIQAAASGGSSIGAAAYYYSHL